MNTTCTDQPRDIAAEACATFEEGCQLIADALVEDHNANITSTELVTLVELQREGVAITVEGDQGRALHTAGLLTALLDDAEVVRVEPPDDRNPVQRIADKCTAHVYHEVLRRLRDPIAVAVCDAVNAAVDELADLILLAAEQRAQNQTANEALPTDT